MGISIHYQGSINNSTLIPKFIDELSDIARDMQWKSVIVDPDDETEPPPVTGIVIDMCNGSEVMPFLFDNNGVLRSVVSLAHFSEHEEGQKIVSIKTQYSSAKFHIALTKLLRFIKKKYISNMKVRDEGEYWESLNAERLEQLMELINRKLDELCDVLEGTKGQFSEVSSPEEFANKLEEIIQRHMTLSSDEYLQ